jgi:replicative DNA helicase
MIFFIVAYTKVMYIVDKEVNISREQLVSLLKLDLEEMKQNLTVPVKTTSAYKNSKRSATDDRTSLIQCKYSTNTNNNF